MKKIVICDIDGTLSDATHRQHLIQSEGWDSFYDKMEFDDLNEWCDNLIDALQASDLYDGVYLVTGRPEKYREITKGWLYAHMVHFDGLFMRPDTLPNGKPDHREDYTVKQEIYDKEFKDKMEVAFVIDDRKQVVDMWRRNGLTVLQCAEGNF